VAALVTSGQLPAGELRTYDYRPGNCELTTTGRGTTNLRLPAGNYELTTTGWGRMAGPLWAARWLSLCPHHRQGEEEGDDSLGALLILFLV
jgi:hypothetical protein